MTGAFVELYQALGRTQRCKIMKSKMHFNEAKSKGLNFGDTLQKTSWVMQIFCLFGLTEGDGLKSNFYFYFFVMQPIRFSPA